MKTKLLTSLLFLFALAPATGGCTGLFDNIASGIEDSLKNVALNTAFEQIKGAAEQEGGTAELIRDFDAAIQVEITDKSSSAFGAAISLPAGAITAEVDAVILSIQPVPGDTAPRNLTDEAVGPIIDFRIQPAGLDGDVNGEITDLALSATLSLPFSAEAVTEEDVPFAARLKAEGEKLIFEKLDAQELDPTLTIVRGTTTHLSQYSAAAEHPLAPPAIPAPSAIAGLNKESGYSTVSSNTTQLCQKNYSEEDITLDYSGPVNNGSSMLTIGGQLSGGTDLMLFFDMGTTFLPLVAPADLKPMIVDSPMNHFSVSCYDNAKYQSAFSVAPTKTYNALQLVALAVTSETEGDPCPNDPTKTCNVSMGTALVYWDISAIDMNNANFSGISRAYRTVDLVWTEFLD